MKKLVLILAIVFSGCNLCNILQDLYTSDKLNKCDIYKTTCEANNFSDIGRWVSRNIEYKIDTVGSWDSVQTVVERGWGDCKDKTRVFLDICYTNLGVSGDLLTIESRDILDGGPINHAVAIVNGTIYESSGVMIEVDKIGYIYHFKNLFNF